MTHTHEALKRMTVAELRDIAQGLDNEEVKGASQMNKDHLLPVLCRALGIDVHDHHIVTGINKVDIKARMRELKAQRAAALEAHDHERLRDVRRQIHHLNHQIRAHMS
jgi:hypothetical protein